MHLFRLVIVAMITGALSAPLAAQGIPRGSRTTQAVANAPRLMVANPFAFAPADSANAVRIGTAAREQMKDIAGRNFTVVEQAQMNDALKQYGYPVDAILSPPLAVTLAKNIQARALMTGTLAKGEGGRTTVTARLSGVNDDAGNVVMLTQGAGQSLDDFGKKLALALAPAVKALPDAKACVDQRTTKPDKAAEAANKAIKALPNHGLAEYCLAQIAMDKKAPRAEVVKHLQAAAKGDPLSLPVWTALATQYQQANDTANTLVAFKEMLRVAPTNQKLREELFKYFLQSGHPETALEVADAGLKLDPYNADLYDLKSNACLFLSNFKCAVDALETMYTTDSTKADTLFFTKISAAAAEGEKPDSVRLLKWSRIGTKKYPDNMTLLGYLNRGYVLNGQVDSSIAVTQKLMAKDTTEVTPALAAVQALAQSHRLNEAAPFIDYVAKHGDPQRKEQLAGILVTSALPLLQGDSAKGQKKDLEGAATYAKAAVAVADPKGKVGPTANYILGLALFLQAAELDAQTEKNKSCDMATQEQQLLADADAALTAGQAAKPDAVAQYQGYIKKFNPRVSAMLKAYCKKKKA
jgi:tetratricopeptide (TPR) repeat protein